VMGEVVLVVWLVGMFTGDLKNACHDTSVEWGGEEEEEEEEAAAEGVEEAEMGCCWV
jgi:hypothetical protein